MTFRIFSETPMTVSPVESSPDRAAVVQLQLAIANVPFVNFKLKNPMEITHRSATGSTETGPQLETMCHPERLLIVKESLSVIGVLPGCNSSVAEKATEKPLKRPL